MFVLGKMLTLSQIVGPRGCRFYNARILMSLTKYLFLCSFLRHVVFKDGAMSNDGRKVVL